MDAHYRVTLERLWRQLQKLGQEVPRVAPATARNADPRMTRLVEGFAYLMASAKNQLDEEKIQLVTGFLSEVIPSALRPFPAGVVMQSGRIGMKAEASVIQAGSIADSVEREGRICTFQTTRPCQRLHLALAECSVRRESRSESALTLVLEALDNHTLVSQMPASLRIYAGIADRGLRFDLLRALDGIAQGITARVRDAAGNLLAEYAATPLSLRWLWTPDDAPFEPAPLDSWGATQRLRTLLTFPDVFSFFTVEGLERLPLGAVPGAKRIELQIPLPTTIEGAENLDAQSFALGCTPAINLYEEHFPAPSLAIFPHRAELELTSQGRDVYRLLAVHMAGETLPYRHDFAAQRLARRHNVTWDLFRPQREVGEGTTCVLASLSPTGPTAPPSPLTSLQGLVTDGARAASLGPGELTSRTQVDGLRNRARVVPGIPLLLGRDLYWRYNACARMPVQRFARADTLAAFVALHDLPRQQRTDPARSAALRHPGLLSTDVKPTRRPHEGFRQDGLKLTLFVDSEAMGGSGMAWLLTQLLFDAMVERTMAVMFVELEVIDTTGMRWSFAPTSGHLLSRPFV